MQENKPNTNIKKKKKKKKSKHPVKKVFSILGTVLLSIFLIFIITGSIIVTALTIYVVNFMDSTTDVTLENLQMNFTTFFYAKDKDGNDVIIDSITKDGEKRIWVDLPEIPQHVRDALVYSEDERFYSHDGVDFKRTFAAFANVFLKFYDTEQGGSTITQQTIKNITGDNETDYARKIREIFRAINVEKNYNKDDILEAYLNVIAFGNNTNGVEAASQFYFHKNVGDLTIAEAASIAAITKSPTANNPLKYPEKNSERKEYILSAMEKNGAISTDEYEKALEEELNFKGSMPSSIKTDDEKIDLTTSNDKLEWYVDSVITDVIADFQEYFGVDWETADNMIKGGGYKIYTSVDIDMQTTVTENFEDPYTFSSAIINDPPQAAFIALDYMGNVKAIVGEVGVKSIARGYNRALDATRSPGSTIKPIASYGPAIYYDKITWSTMFKDSPMTITDDNGDEVKWPKNYSNRWSGANYMTWQGLQSSLNTTAAQIVELLTPKTSFDFLENNVHLSTLVTYREGKTDIGLAPMAIASLTDGTKLVEVVGAYQIFGNGGKYYEPTFYSKITDKDDNIVLEHKYIGQQAIDSQSSYIMNRMLKTVVDDANGTGRLAKLSNVEVVAKTGTSDEWRDLSFVACTPDYVSAVWYGYDEPKEMQNSPYFKVAQVWKNVFGEVANQGSRKTFAEDPNVEKLYYCTQTGLIASDTCPYRSKNVGYYKSTNIPGKCTH